MRSEATEGEFSVTTMREQVSLAMSGTDGHHGDVLDAVMAVVGSVERERDEARASVEHLRGDYRRIRKDRDRLLLAWRSAHRRANQFRWLHAEAVWQRDQLQVERDDLDQELDAERITKPTMARIQRADDQAALRASAVVLPKDWRQRLGGCESSGAAVDLVESWLGTVEAAPPHGPDAAPAVIPTFEMVAWCEIHDADARSCACPEGAYEERHRDCATAGGVCIERHAGVSGTGTEASDG